MTRAQEILEAIVIKNIVADGIIAIEGAPTISPLKLATYLAELEVSLGYSQRNSEGNISKTPHL